MSWERMDVILGHHAWDPYRRIGRMRELIRRNFVCGLVVKGIQLRMLNRARDALPIFQSTCAFHERLLLTRMPRSSIIATVLIGSWLRRNWCVLPKQRTWVFCGSNLMLFLMDQLTRELMSFCTKVGLEPCTLQSSANKKKFEWTTTSGISLIKSRNSSVPNTLPWSIPLPIVCLLDKHPLTLTICCLSVRYDENSIWKLRSNPYVCSFEIKRECGTVSNAFWMSK